MKKILCVLFTILTLQSFLSCSNSKKEKITEKDLLNKTVEFRNLLLETAEAVYDDWSKLGQTPESSKEYRTAKDNQKESFDKLEKALDEIKKMSKHLKSDSDHFEIIENISNGANWAYEKSFGSSWEKIESYQRYYTEAISELDEVINELSAVLDSDNNE